MESTDREERKEAFEKWANLYEGVSDKLDELYDKLIEVRVEMAKKLGYDNYTELAYRNMGRLDYTPEHVEKFREQIRTVITPAVDRMRKAQAKRLGLDSVKYYDESLTLQAATQILSAAKIIWWGRRPKCTARSRPKRRNSSTS
mgnify:CR=1 FL=1